LGSDISDLIQADFNCIRRMTLWMDWKARRSQAKPNQAIHHSLSIQLEFSLEWIDDQFPIEKMTRSMRSFILFFSFPFLPFPSLPFHVISFHFISRHFIPVIQVIPFSSAQFEGW
jgi:hypothetical protein